MNISKLIAKESLIMIHFNVENHDDSKIMSEIMESLVSSTFSIDKEFPANEIRQTIANAKEHFGYEQGQELLMQISPPNENRKVVEYGIAIVKP